MTPVLMYHDVVPAGAEDCSGFPGRDAALYKVTPETFQAHVKAIAGACPAPDPGGSPSSGSARAPIITFDDGGISALYAADELERAGYVGWFFITADYIGAPGFLNGSDLRALKARGHVIGSHSCSHPLRMGHCPAPQLLDEWRTSHARLSSMLGQPIEAASVPGGDYTDAVARAASEAGFSLLFTSEPTLSARVVARATVRGRFTIQRWTSADTVAALASGAWLPRARQALMWNAKKMSKRLGGAGYLKVRQLLLRHGNEVRWGDMR